MHAHANFMAARLKILIIAFERYTSVILDASYFKPTLPDIL